MLKNLVHKMTKMTQILLILVVLTFHVNCELTEQRPRKNTHIIYKKLTPVEISENIPIGYLVTDLKANLVGDQFSSDDFYYTFEFANDLNEKFEKSASNAGSQHQHQSHLHHNHHLLNYIKNYFLLDSYTGTIHTSKSIDSENFCDLNICQNRALSASGEDTGRAQDCLIPFKIKATRHVHLNKTGANAKEAMYHISFDLTIRDINEFKPEFSQKEALTFNVSEEFEPIKLPIGSIAYDNDCNDRNGLFYSVRVNKINQKSVDDFLKEIKSHSIRFVGQHKLELIIFYLILNFFPKF